MSTFSALRYPSFRLLWAGQVLTGLGLGMQQLALGWLAVLLAERDGVPELAPFYIGLVGLSRGVPALLVGLIGGVTADRVDRRLLLWLARGVGTVSAGILAALTLSGHVTIVLAMAISVLDAVTNAFDAPARQVMLSRVVPENALMSAVGLQNGTGQSTMLLGPLLGGVLIVPFGVGGVIAANCVIYLLALAVLIGLPPAPPERTAGPVGVVSSLLEGLRYVVRDPAIRWLLGISAIAGITARPMQWMLPAVAHDTLRVGATELSWLLAGSAAGSLGGTVVAASIGGMRRRGMLLAAAVVGWGALNVAFAAQSSLVPALILVCLPGIPHWIVSGTTIFELQTRTPDEYRGRVMSIFFLTVWGLGPLGVLATGSLGAVVGVNLALAIGGTFFALVGLFVLLRVEVIRGLGIDVAARDVLRGPSRPESVH